jgi:predicted DNA-binding protein
MKLTPKKEKQFGFRLRPQDHTRIKALAKKLEEKASAVVRRAIREMAIREGVER